MVSGFAVQTFSPQNPSLGSDPRGLKTSVTVPLVSKVLKKPFYVQRKSPSLCLWVFPFHQPDFKVSRSPILEFRTSYPLKSIAS